MLFHVDNLCPSRMILRSGRGFAATRSWGIVPPFTHVEVRDVMPLTTLLGRLLGATIRLKGHRYPRRDHYEQAGGSPCAGSRALPGGYLLL